MTTSFSHPRFSTNGFVHIFFAFMTSLLIISNGSQCVAQEPPAPPSGMKIVTEPAENSDLSASAPVQSHALRRAGAFYEVATTITDQELDQLPIEKKCGPSRQLKLDRMDKNLFTATFFVNSTQVGTPYVFQRHRSSSGQMTGGANISSKSCSIGVMVDGGSFNSFDYEVYLIDTRTGAVLFPDGIQFYPKVRNAGGVNYEEPRLWFSPDDTAAMIVAAADEAWRPDTENSMAHFIDTASGQTIQKVLFRWPQKATSTVPYRAGMEIKNGERHITFSVEKKLIARIVVP